jgi:hypothetical protein
VTISINWKAVGSNFSRGVLGGFPSHSLFTACVRLALGPRIYGMRQTSSRQSSLLGISSDFPRDVFEVSLNIDGLFFLSIVNHFGLDREFIVFDIISAVMLPIRSREILGKFVLERRD